MLAQDSEWIGWSNTTPVALARAAAFLIVPELEGYQWMDRYFDQSDADIIAVFDHDAFFITARRVFVLAVFVAWCAFMFWQLRPDPHIIQFRPSTRSQSQSKECNFKTNKSAMAAFMVMMLIGWVVHINPLTRP